MTHPGPGPSGSGTHLCHQACCLVKHKDTISATVHPTGHHSSPLHLRGVDPHAVVGWPERGWAAEGAPQAHLRAAASVMAATAGPQVVQRSPCPEQGTSSVQEQMVTTAQAEDRTLSSWQHLHGWAGGDITNL